MRLRLLAALLLVLPLSACNGYFGSSDGDGDDGGGDGGDSDAQGLWVGTTSDRFRFHLLVTPNNEVWGLSWDESFNQVNRLTQGSGSSNGTTFSGSAKNFAAGAGGTVSNAELSGTVSSGSSFNGNLGQNITFTSSFNSQYDGAFNRADFAGTWTGYDSDGGTVTFEIATNGDYTARSQIAGRPDTCRIDGGLSAGAGSKNYAVNAMTFGNDTNCADTVATRSLQGVAVRLAEADPAAAPLLLVEAVNSERSVAWFAYARKQAAR